MTSGALDSRVALVTGAAGAGIGRATAAALAREGARVVVTDIHARRTDETVAALREQHGDRVTGRVLDCGDRAGIARVVGEVTSDIGPIEILVNNAAVNPMVTMLDSDPAVWDTAIEVDLTGPWHLIRAVLPGMIGTGRGSIINVTSVAAFISPHAEGPYAAAKAGLHSLTRTVAREYGPAGVRCNSVAPGLIWTRFMEKYEEQFRPEVERTPLRRWGQPDDIAETIVFLASDRSSFITGETITISGGWYLRP